MKKPKLKLSSSSNNVYSILAKARKAAEKAHWRTNKWLDFLDEAKSCDYDHLIQTCMRYFNVC